MDEKAPEDKAVCAVEGCGKPQAGEVPMWQQQPITTEGGAKPNVMVNLPLCSEHFAEYQEIKGEAFSKKYQLRTAL